jgi:hypothetical protein
MATPSWFFYAFVPLVVWRIYARIRRHIGRQRSRAWRHWVGVVLFPLLIALFALAAMVNPVAEIGLLSGVAGGVILGTWALRLTRYERTDQGFFYTPNAYIGVGLSLLLVGRILYRMEQVYVVGGAPASPDPAFARSPLTLLIFGLVAGYYAMYAAGLLRWRSREGAAAKL